MGLSPEAIYRFEKRAPAFLDSIRPRLKIELVDSEFADIDRGRKYAEELRDWNAAFSHFYTVMIDDERPYVERTDAAIWASQMLINMSRLRDAKQMLEMASNAFDPKISGNDSLSFRARVNEKHAWISDYRVKPKEELRYFETAESYALGIPEEARDEDIKKLLSTIEHFRGRAHFVLAWSGEDKEINLREALKSFERDLGNYMRVREAGKPDPQGEGFNHIWIARCYIYGGNFDLTDEEIGKGLTSFKEEIERNPLKRDLLAHYHLVRAEYFIMLGNPKLAIIESERALAIRLEKKPNFPKGQIEALAIMALASWQDRSLGYAFVCGRRALQIVKNLRS